MQLLFQAPLDKFLGKKILIKDLELFLRLLLKWLSMQENWGNRLKLKENLASACFLIFLTILDNFDLFRAQFGHTMKNNLYNL